jgi:hypothetical protein
MSSGSTNLDPKYTSFFPNGLADGRRSNESPVPQEQRSGDNMNANKAASSPQANTQAKAADSKAERSVGLVLKCYLEFGHANVRSASVWCCSRTAPPKESRPISIRSQPPRRMTSTYTGQNRPCSLNTENFKAENNLEAIYPALGGSIVQLEDAWAA